MDRQSVKVGAGILLSALVLVHGCSPGEVGKPFGVSGIHPKRAPDPDAVLRWDAVALRCEAEDHTGTYGVSQNGGPTRSSRAMAIVHLAIYDAVMAIDGSHEPYLPVTLSPSVTHRAAVAAAVAQAGHDSLVALYSYQKAYIDEELRVALAELPAKGRSEGIQVGAQAAGHILKHRVADGYADGDAAIYPVLGNDPALRQHQPDPYNPDQGLLTPGWGQVATFSALDVTAPHVRTPPPPASGAPAYAIAFQDVKALGGDGYYTPTIRTPEQTEIGLFWAYDGRPKLGTPPRLYNQVLRKVAKVQKNTLVQNARLFALANMAMADCGIACWDSKYYYNLWRPVIGIRNADPTLNGGTIPDPLWQPLGAPYSNAIGPNFTPPFPAYPSGHATFGGAVFSTLRHFYGTDALTFTLMSDELKEGTTDNQGNPRPTVVRHFTSFSQAARENARSRIYLGIHWQFDADAGIDQGTTIANHVWRTQLQPVRKGH